MKVYVKTSILQKVKTCIENINQPSVMSQQESQKYKYLNLTCPSSQFLLELSALARFKKKRNKGSLPCRPHSSSSQKTEQGEVWSTYLQEWMEYFQHVWQFHVVKARWITIGIQNFLFKTHFESSECNSLCKSCHNSTEYRILANVESV